MRAPIHHDEIYERIQKVIGTRTQNDLAQLLEIKQSSISDAKRRNAIPADWLMTLFENLKINPRWLKYGTGPRFLRTKEENSIEENLINSNVGVSSYNSSLILPWYTPV